MATTYPIHPSAELPRSEHHVVHATQVTLKWLYGLVPVIAGADKFTNFIVDWEQYLNPMLLRIVPVTPHQFMLGVGIIEIVAGILVFLKPRIGGFIVMLWLLGIAAQLIAWGQHLDVALRDIVMALGGALALVKFTPFVERPAEIDRAGPET